jgi:hypothetical protein
MDLIPPEPSQRVEDKRGWAVFAKGQGGKFDIINGLD